MCPGYPSFNSEEIFVEYLVGISFPPCEKELGEVPGGPCVHRLTQHGKAHSLPVALELELMSL